MRLVFDTNVLFAAYIARGTCAVLYDQALAVAALLTSDFILDEFERTLVTKGKVAPELAAEARAKVTAHSRLVAIAPAGRTRLPRSRLRCDPRDSAGCSGIRYPAVNLFHASACERTTTLPRAAGG